MIIYAQKYIIYCQMTNHFIPLILAGISYAENHVINKL